MFPPEEPGQINRESMSNRVSLRGVLCDSPLKTSAQLHGRRNYVSAHIVTLKAFFFRLDDQKYPFSRGETSGIPSEPRFSAAG